MCDCQQPLCKIFAVSVTHSLVHFHASWWVMSCDTVLMSARLKSTNSAATAAFMNPVVQSFAQADRRLKEVPQDDTKLKCTVLAKCLKKFCFT